MLSPPGGSVMRLWPLPYGTACCGIELMSVMGPKYDLARFGAEVVRFSVHDKRTYF
jgi:NADH-quinone oxidoreductase subunit B